MKPWLGGDLHGKWSNHYELLGLPNGFDDVATIDHIASLLIDRLNSQELGELGFQPHKLESLVMSVHEARACLTNPAARRVYNESIRRTDVNDPTQRQQGLSPGTSLDDIPTAIPVAEPVERVESSLTFENSPVAQFQTRRVMRGTRRGNRAKRSWGTAATIGLGGLLFLGIAFLAKQLLDGTSPIVVADGSSQTQPAQQDRSRERIQRDEGNEEHKADVPLAPEDHIRPLANDSTTPSPTTPSPTTPSSTTPRDAPTISSEVDSVEASNQPSVSLPPPATSQTFPTDTELSQSEIPPLAQNEVQRLSQALNAIPSSLQTKRFQRANKAISVAQDIARHPKHIQLVTGFSELIHYTQEYWAAFDEAWIALTAGHEIVVGSTRVSVVDISADRLTLRVAGSNKRYRRGGLPVGLQQAIVSNWLNPDAPSTQLILGAFWAVRSSRDESQAAMSEGDFAKARAHWTTAKDPSKAGESLLLTLSASYDVRMLRRLETGD